MTYLLQDVEKLCPTESKPSFLHGDLTPANILIQGCANAAEAEVRLIDFGDAGFGDPLFDLIALHLITFRYPTYKIALSA